MGKQDKQDDINEKLLHTEHSNDGDIGAQDSPRIY